MLRTYDRIGITILPTFIKEIEIHYFFFFKLVIAYNIFDVGLEAISKHV